MPEIRLVAEDGTTIEPVRDHVDAPVFEHLVAGRYVLRAVLRPCDGNCGYLDGPTARAARSSTCPPTGPHRCRGASARTATSR